MTDLIRSRNFWCCAIAFLLVSCGANELFAQAPVAPPAGGTTVIVQGRSLSFEWIITIAMCGAALFVVCRSSRRN